MTQAPATPELVERLKGLLVEEDRMHPLGCATWIEEVCVTVEEAADALEAQQARIAELEAALRAQDDAERRDEQHQELIAQSVGEGWDEVTGGSHLDADWKHVSAAYAKARELRVQALSSQGRHEGGEAGSIPELPGVNAVPLPASPDGLLPDEERNRLRTMVWMAWREMNAVRAATGSPRGYDGYSLGCYEEWWSDMVEAMGRELGDADRKPWSAEYMRPHLDAMRTAVPSPDNTNPKAGAPEHG